MKDEYERNIQKVCLDWLKLFGAVPIRVNSAAVKIGDRFFNANDQPGCSDCIVCMPDGVFCAIEFKKPGKKLTAKQKAFQDKIAKATGMVLVIHSLEELKAALVRDGYDVELRQ